MSKYKITRSGDDSATTMSLCVERDVQAKRKATTFLNYFAACFKFILVTFAIDPLRPIDLTHTLYGEWPENYLLHPFLKAAIVLLMGTNIITRVIDSSLWKEELLIVKEFGV